MQGQAKLFAHVPDCAQPTMARPIPWEQKAHNATLIGHTWDKLYPLRPRIKEAIDRGLIPGGDEHKHPGYNAGPNGKRPVEGAQDYAMHAAAIQPLEEQFATYFESLARSRVCMFDSSIVRKGIAKYFEAMMAGCVVAADLPFEMEELLRDAMVVLEADDSPQAIADKVNAALADPSTLRVKAARGMRLARQHFTCEHKLERILDEAWDYKSGGRGYHFPFGFRIGRQSCRIDLLESSA